MSGASNPLAIVFFFVFISATLGITYWAAKRTKTTAHFYAAGGGITGFQNGLALAGDYMSAASFLGIAGDIGRAPAADEPRAAATKLNSTRAVGRILSDFWFKLVGRLVRRPGATNGESMLRSDEESACAHKLDDPQLPRKAPVELTADVPSRTARRLPAEVQVGRTDG
jgi:hypothetical protein